ncbi:MAG: helix-turn-helix transcriptional regulator [Pseudomonadota bacterium]
MAQTEHHQCRPNRLPDPWDGRALRSHFLDSYVGKFPNQTLDTVGHMLLQVDRTRQVMQVGVAHLARTLKAGRVDIGFGHARHPTYAAAAESFLDEGDDRPSMVDRELPNGHHVIQRVWRSATPVAYDDVPNNAEVAPMREAFAAVHARAMLAQRLAVDDHQGAFGLICVDELDYGRRWKAAEHSLLHEFCSTFFAPILAVSLELSAPVGITKPSPAELDAIRLAATGQSYKAIAYSLGKSIRTIETQLRNARQKVGAANQAELVRICEAWL